MDDKNLIKRAKVELRDAYEYDQRDPLFGLTKDDLRGDQISRRATLRLLAVGGALGLAQVLPGLRSTLSPNSLEVDWTTKLDGQSLVNWMLL